MERVAQRDLHTLLMVLQELEEFGDLRTFPRRVLPLLHRLVPYDVATYNEVNPRHGRRPTRQAFAGHGPDG